MPRNLGAWRSNPPGPTGDTGVVALSVMGSSYRLKNTSSKKATSLFRHKPPTQSARCSPVKVEADTQSFLKTEQRPKQNEGKAARWIHRRHKGQNKSRSVGAGDRTRACGRVSSPVRRGHVSWGPRLRRASIRRGPCWAPGAARSQVSRWACDYYFQARLT